MTTQTMSRSGFLTRTQNKNLTWLEVLTLRKFHPRAILLEIVGVNWAVYFLWNNDWQRALLIYLAASFLSTVSVWNISPEKMASTRLGKLALLHLHPFNFIVQALSLIPIVYGIWIHSADFILYGVSGLLVGHLFGWSKVDPNFETIEP